MISIIITTYKEKDTLPKCLTAILTQTLTIDHEIFVVGPDSDTENVVKQFAVTRPQVYYIRDQHLGKPAALNLAFKQTRGEILVLTDGDVWIGDNSLEKLLNLIANPNVGAVTGHPLPINPRNNIFGYWAHFLTNAAHQTLLISKSFPCSGYFYAFRKKLINEIPEETFSEDGWITQQIRDQGYTVGYASEALVYVKYPTNFHDWLIQKKRSTGGYIQIKELKNERNIGNEIAGGIRLFFTYPKNIQELYWTKLLYFSRLYLWLLIFWQIKIKKVNLKNIWQRVESTK